MSLAPVDVAHRHRRTIDDRDEVASTTAIPAEQSILESMWDDARRSGREAAWHLLPERAIARLADRPEGVTEADLTFLASRLAGSSIEARSAVRLLATIGEDQLAPADLIGALLRDFLAHRDPSVRMGATEGIWQMLDPTLRSALLDARARESEPAVQRTMDHVLRLLV